MNKVRTAIFGGSFDPIHAGHVALACAVRDNGLADEVWFLITPLNPHKQGKLLTDENLRLQMAQLALAGENALVASDFEFSLPRPSYTINTLDALEKNYPCREFLLLMGACTEHERRGVSPLPQNRPADWESRPFGPMMN